MSQKLELIWSTILKHMLTKYTANELEINTEQIVKSKGLNLIYTEKRSIRMW